MHPVVDLCSPGVWWKVSSDPTPPQTPLQCFVDAYVQIISYPPNHCCPTCSQPYALPPSTTIDAMWLWFEIFHSYGRIILPSPSLIFTCNGTPLQYDLVAIIYGDGLHFTARWCNPTGTWWSYDGRQLAGCPQIDNPNDLNDLGGRAAHILLYCLTPFAVELPISLYPH